MATGRILKRSISLSEQANDLSLKATLLFTWAIPHLDDFGRMGGSPRRVKAEVVPMRLDFTTDDVAECLREMHESGLITWYEVGEELYLQYPKFEEHQAGLHKRTASKIPEVPAGSGGPPELPGNSGNFPPRVRALNGTELKGREQKGTEGKAPSIDDTSPSIKPVKIEYAESVRMTEEQHGKLLAEFGAVGTAERIEKLSLYKQSKGKRYKCDYSTILAWDRKDKQDHIKAQTAERKSSLPKGLLALQRVYEEAKREEEGQGYE